MLDLDRKPEFDERLFKFEYHAHESYASSRFLPSDEVRFPFSQPGEYVLVSKSYLYVEGTLSKHDRYTLAPNAIAHAFDEVKLAINGEIVDRTNYPGITSNLKAYASYNKSTIKGLEHAGWMIPTSNEALNPCVDVNSGTFSACVPLDTLLGFAEDYRQVLVNVRMELIVNRSASNTNMIIPRLPVASGGTLSTGSPDVTITKMIWYLPYATPSDSEKVNLLTMLGKDEPITMAFRSWNLTVFPSLPANKEFSWTVRNTTDLEKPRYVLFAMQTDRQKKVDKNAGFFDHCKLKNLRLHIGSQVFPYSRLNLDFDKKRATLLYQMYVEFQKSYYSKEWAEPLWTFEEFLKNAPIAIIDCSHQIESSTGNNVVDVRLEFETQDAVPANTTAYCLLLQDSVVTYTPLSGIVRKGGGGM